MKPAWPGHCCPTVTPGSETGPACQSPPPGEQGHSSCFSLPIPLIARSPLPAESLLEPSPDQDANSYARSSVAMQPSLLLGTKGHSRCSWWMQTLTARDGTPSCTVQGLVGCGDLALVPELLVAKNGIPHDHHSGLVTLAWSLEKYNRGLLLLPVPVKDVIRNSLALVLGP